LTFSNILNISSISNKLINELTNERMKQNSFIIIMLGGGWHESESEVEVEDETESEGVDEEERRK
jgi:hypothetical protein